MKNIDNYKDENYKDEFISEMKELDKKQKSEKADFKKQLKGLINVTGLYKWLDEDHFWKPEDIVEIELSDEKRPGYSKFQCARIKGENSQYLYMKMEHENIARGIYSYWVWQTVGYMGDDFSGYLLFELKNGKYFKIYYEC